MVKNHISRKISKIKAYIERKKGIDWEVQPWDLANPKMHNLYDKLQDKQISKLIMRESQNSLRNLPPKTETIQ